MLTTRFTQSGNLPRGPLRANLFRSSAIARADVTSNGFSFSGDGFVSTGGKHCGTNNVRRAFLTGQISSDGKR